MTAIAAAAAQLDLASLYDDTISQHVGYMQQLDWAEDEIQAGMRRHPRAADVIWHSLTLTTPTADLMRVETVYRAHCREIVDRVAAGQDTRPGTAVEVAILCCHVSGLAPLTATAAGLYFRMLRAAELPFAVDDERAGAYEQLRGDQIDDAEAEARHKLADKTRTLRRISCGGKHHGTPVACRYAPAARGELLF
jgi:hypothetical protein